MLLSLLVLFRKHACFQPNFRIINSLINKNEWEFQRHPDEQREEEKQVYFFFVIAIFYISNN
jgi:hypothetical protein